eukprot:scaffold66347_cov23-Tisochrysis_lutea.AAC.1
MSFQWHDQLIPGIPRPNHSRTQVKISAGKCIPLKQAPVLCVECDEPVFFLYMLLQQEEELQERIETVDAQRRAAAQQVQAVFQSSLIALEVVSETCLWCLVAVPAVSAIALSWQPGNEPSPARAVQVGGGQLSA